MNITQRKHILSRLAEIYNRKCSEIHDLFSKDPINKSRVTPYIVYPNYTDMVLSMMGLPSPAVLRFSGEKLEEELRSSHNPQISHFTYPTNKSEIDEIVAYNLEIATRKNIKVHGKLVLLKHAFDNYKDRVILLKDSNEILAVVAEFQAFGGNDD